MEDGNIIKGTVAVLAQRQEVVLLVFQFFLFVYLFCFPSPFFLNSFIRNEKILNVKYQQKF